MQRGRLHHYPLAYCIAGILLGLLPEVRATWLGFFVLSALIVAYGACVYKLPDLDNQDKGENCYVIGFVFTLVVITLTLIFDAEKFVGTAGADSGAHGDLASLLSTIGVALGTSVVGMLGRSLFVHTLSSKKEDEYQMHVRRTAVAAGQMAAEVDKLNTSLASASTELKAYAMEVGKETERVSGTMTSAFAVALERIGELITEIMARGQFEKLFAQLERTLRSNDEIVGALRSNTAALNNALSNLRSTAEATQKFIERAGEVLDPHQLQELRWAVKSLGESFDQLAAMPTQLLEQLHSDLPEIKKLREQISSSYGAAIKEAQANERRLLALLVASAEMVNKRLAGNGASPAADEPPQP